MAEATWASGRSKDLHEMAVVGMSLAQDTVELLQRLGVPSRVLGDGDLAIRSPVTGEQIAVIRRTSGDQVEAVISGAARAFHIWARTPAPRRGELIRLIGAELRAAKVDLARLVSIEAGKIMSESLGEVQEMIDICDFAVGLSRQLYGLAIPSERPDHRLLEQWHPAGPVGVISAFNFPVAVWSWNAALALVCGDPVIWKPSEKTPLTALAVQAAAGRAAQAFGSDAPDGLLSLLIGEADLGQRLAADPRIAVLSATGSTRMGRAVAQTVAQRLGRSILELGGNNATIVAPSADLALAVRAVAFGAIGTAGQRCTTLRRLIVHESLYDSLVGSLKRVFSAVTVGDPLKDDVLVGPLIDASAYGAMLTALNQSRDAGGRVTGGDRVDVNGPSSFYVRPALVELEDQRGPMLRETFAPILYVIRYADLRDAIAVQNAVPQGLSSSIFSTDIREVEAFLSAAGSDCGIANVNGGTSGAEIGGAFGGEKETGGGRESGSDAWKGYMRRQTSAINYGRELPLAQGVRFDVTEYHASPIGGRA